MKQSIDQIDIYFDGQPSDWIEQVNTNSLEPKWHTLSFLVIDNYEEYAKFEHQLEKDIGSFKKWSAGEPYRTKFIKSFCEHWSDIVAFLNIVSFDQKELFDNKELILENWSESGQSIGLGKYLDDYGNKRGLAQYVSFDGFHSIDLKITKFFTLLPFAFLIRSQYFFYEQKYGRTNFSVNLKLDPISGDNDQNIEGMNTLKKLVLFQHSNSININFIEIPKKQQKSPNYLVDNTSGFFNFLLDKTLSTKKDEELTRKILKKITWKRLKFVDKNYSLENITIDNLNQQ